MKQKIGKETGKMNEKQSVEQIRRIGNKLVSGEQLNKKEEQMAWKAVGNILFGEDLDDNCDECKYSSKCGKDYCLDTSD